MKLIRIKLKTGDVFRLDVFPTSIDGEICKYFTYGEGYKKTKRFEITEVDLPELRTKLSWLEVCKIHEKYGIEVSDEYASCKTAGIVSRQTIRGKFSLYEKIKDLIPENFDEFFDLLKCDYMLSCFGMYLIDIPGLDSALSKLDPEYSDVNAKYKAQTCSMSKYISLKYGENYSQIVAKLI